MSFYRVTNANTDSLFQFVIYSCKKHLWRKSRGFSFTPRKWEVYPHLFRVRLTDLSTDSSAHTRTELSVWLKGLTKHKCTVQSSHSHKATISLNWNYTLFVMYFQFTYVSNQNVYKEQRTHTYAHQHWKLTSLCNSCNNFAILREEKTITPQADENIYKELHNCCKKKQQQQ